MAIGRMKRFCSQERLASQRRHEIGELTVSRLSRYVLELGLLLPRVSMRPEYLIHWIAFSYPT